MRAIDVDQCIVKTVDVKRAKLSLTCYPHALVFLNERAAKGAAGLYGYYAANQLVVVRCPEEHIRPDGYMLVVAQSGDAIYLGVDDSGVVCVMRGCRVAAWPF